ncbi:MAG: fibronectin type III domain-containing protein, partial [Candidatus Thorarchaeota archaeon]
TSWGQHTLRWTYTKDFSVSANDDCGRIDNILIHNIDYALEIPHLDWITSGDADWFIDTATYKEGGSSARSGDIEDNEESWMQTTIQGPAIVSFDWKVSSEQRFDFLRFLVDGAEKAAISGSRSWTRLTYHISSWGAHTLRWVYTKDFSLSYYSDCGWVDNLRFIPFDNALDIELPTSPQNLQASVVDDQIQLTWDVPLIDGDPPIIGYEVYRGTSPESVSYYASVEDTSFADTDINENTDYYYEVSAVNTVGVGPRTDYIMVTIGDDDTTPPIISWEYVGGNSDGDPGYIVVTASDESGLSEDPSGTYYLSSVLGDQSFTFTAVDADDDRPGDSLSTTITVIIDIDDDDTTAPVITWEYFGSNTDGDAGYLEVTASDASGLSVDPSGTYYLTNDTIEQSFEFTAVDADNDRPDDELSTTITVSITIEDDDTIAPVILWEYFGSYTDGDPGYIVVTATDTSGLSEDPSGTYYLSSVLGEQSFTFTAADGDNDRPHDTLSTTVTVTIEIVDDDTTAPEILWEYFGSNTDGDPGYIVVIATDASGLSEDPSGTYYLSPNIGQQTFEFTAIDDDDDRPEDRLGITVSVTIEVGDDDTAVPEILWEYFGSNTDEDPGYIVVTATDTSGLSEDPSGTYYLTSALGEQSFTFTAVDADEDRPEDQLSTTITASIVIEDDDTTAPEILWEYFGSYTDGNPGYIVVTADDASGLSEDPSGTYYISAALGAQTFTFMAVDADDDRKDDNLCTSVTVTIEIDDDDKIAPEAVWEYFGGYTDGDPGYIVVTATDDSGLSEDPSGTYHLTTELGDQVFEFVAVDADADRTGDQLSTTVTVTITIVDDDTVPPEIQIEYLGGDGTDANPGYFTWTVTDAGDGFSVDGGGGLSEINITINYTSLDGLGDYSIVLLDVASGTWNLQSDLGTYSITVFARDDDDDRTLAVDSLTSELSLEQDIIDDDTSPPDVSNVLITETAARLIVTFSASDDSGIASIEILIDGQAFAPVVQSQEFETYTFEYSMELFFGTQTWEHLLEIRVTDGDDDRPFDSLTTDVTESFVLSPEHLLRFIEYELLMLKAEINENLEDKVRRMLDCLLDKAIDRIRDALELYLEGRISLSLMLERLTKAILHFSEIITEIGNCHDKIDEAFAQHLVDRLHEIRDHVTYAMGASIGTEAARAIADVEIRIDRFADGLYESLSFWDALMIDMHLKQTVRKLDQTLIQLARGNDCAATHKLAKAVRALEHTKCWVKALERFGRISGDVADGLISEIDALITSLQQIEI